MRFANLLWLLGAAPVLAEPKVATSECAPVTVTATVFASASVSTTSPKLSTSSATATSTPKPSSTGLSSAPVNQKAASGYRNVLYFTNW